LQVGTVTGIADSGGEEVSPLIGSPSFVRVSRPDASLDKAEIPDEILQWTLRGKFKSVRIRPLGFAIYIAQI
jgi:hypothetical protein